MPNFWYDFSSVTYSDVLTLGFRHLPLDRIMFGSDIPCDLVRGTMLSFGLGWEQITEDDIARARSALPQEWPIMNISAFKDIGLDELKDFIYDNLGFMRVFLKPQGQEADMEEPLIVKDDSTVENICVKSGLKVAAGAGERPEATQEETTHITALARAPLRTPSSCRSRPRAPNWNPNRSNIGSKSRSNQESKVFREVMFFYRKAKLFQCSEG